MTTMATGTCGKKILITRHTLGPTYNEFGYNEFPATTSK